MLTRSNIRTVALAMPEAYEASHFDVIDYRVNKKIFCTLSSDPPRAVLKFTPEDQYNLLDGQVLQKIPGAWGARGWTYLYYEQLEPTRLHDLVRLAWATVAPKRLTRI